MQRQKKTVTETPVIIGKSGFCKFSLGPRFDIDQIEMDPIVGDSLAAEMVKNLQLVKSKKNPPLPAKRYPFTISTIKLNQKKVDEHFEENLQVVVRYEECTIVAKRLKQEGHEQVAILNLANEETIGGGAFRNAKAQEEYLFRTSDLPISLLGYAAQNENGYPPYFKNERPYYGSGSFNSTDVLYSNNTLYRGYNCDPNVQRDPSKPIQFNYDNLSQPVEVNFITSAALYYDKESQQYIEMIAGQRHYCDAFTADIIHTAKIYNQIKVAIEQGNTAIVLGAFGCGAFNNDPVKMAQFYRDILSLPEFIGKIKVEFAIASQHLCQVFSDTFAKKLEADPEKEKILRARLNTVLYYEIAEKNNYEELVRLNNKILPNPNQATEDDITKRNKVYHDYIHEKNNHLILLKYFEAFYQKKYFNEFLPNQQPFNDSTRSLQNKIDFLIYFRDLMYKNDGRVRYYALINRFKNTYNITLPDLHQFNEKIEELIERHRTTFISKLEKYMTDRVAQAAQEGSIYTFFRGLAGHSDQEKCNAAQKLLKFIKGKLNPEEPISFTEQEIKILTEGRLGNIYREFKEVVPELKNVFKTNLFIKSDYFISRM